MPVVRSRSAITPTLRSGNAESIYRYRLAKSGQRQRQEAASIPPGETRLVRPGYQVEQQRGGPGSRLTCRLSVGPPLPQSVVYFKLPDGRRSPRMYTVCADIRRTSHFASDIACCMTITHSWCTLHRRVEIRSLSRIHNSHIHTSSRSVGCCALRRCYKPIQARVA